MPPLPYAPPEEKEPPPHDDDTEEGDGDMDGKPKPAVDTHTHPTDTLTLVLPSPLPATARPLTDPPFTTHARNTSDSDTCSEIVPPFPWLMVCLLSAVNLNEAFQQNVLWPFVPELIRVFDIGEPDQNGFYAGVLAASYFFAQLLSSLPWGILSDRVGRRPVLLFGTLGATAATFAFGVSTDYTTAICSRFLAGFLSGNLGTTKTYLSEELHKAHTARGLSTIGFAGGLGGIIGPVIGGYLAFPAEQYPSVFGHDSVFGKYPVLLPELVSVGVGVIAFLLAIKFLPESQAFLRQQRYRQLAATQQQQPLIELTDTHTTMSTDDNEELKSPALSHHALPSPSSLSYRTSMAVAVAHSTSSHNRFASMIAMCKRRQVFVTTGIYGLLALAFIIFDEMFSFFFEASTDDNGMGFSASKTGTFLSITGASLIVFQLIIFPPMVERLGVMRCWKLWMLVSIPYFVLFPSLHYVQRVVPDWLLFVIIAMCCIVRAGVGACVFTPIFILIGGSCPSSMLGAANGLGQSWAALARTFGPVLGGGVWSMSLDWGPLHAYAVYGITGVVLLFAYHCRVNLSPYINWDDDPEQRKEFGLPPLDSTSASARAKARHTHTAVAHAE